MEPIRHANIIYMPTISPLGGIETYVYEMVKKYSYLDIAVVSKNCDPLQANRIRNYCKLYIWTGQPIECKVAIINYDQTIIDSICSDAKIYQTIHADYSMTEIYHHRPSNHPRITAFIAITDTLLDKMKSILNTDKIIMSYNPLTVEKVDKPIVIVCASRLHEHKGKGRIIELTNAFDRAGVSYILFLITNETHGISNPNVIFIPNRLNIAPWLEIADYVLLLSDSEACSYTLNEALYRNIPIIATPLPYLKEIGVEDGKNAYIVKFDCSNVDDVAKKITSVPKFTFKKMEDKYGELFVDSKSHYEEDRAKLTKCVCARSFVDKFGVYHYRGDELELDWDRASSLVDRQYVRII